MKLLLGTKNPNKIAEIKSLLPPDIEILTALDMNLPEVIEDRNTIAGNAEKKALEYAQATGKITLADDTGFFVEALQGKPGVKAARYAGENCSYHDNRQKMLKEMQNKQNRRAAFKTAAALASPDGIIATVFGEVIGEITEREIGSSGFGYDPIFLAAETGKTFGEMTPKEKHKISHRARALQKIIPIILQYRQKTEK
ncbi:MAG: RdgB/HAM1 family non-canonical purine NTP pyrophosphatase [Candidatus Cloacimonadota bacterium]|nr:RdgB/HAM1 family non-canonical purine NTP pyrophosphatase [Candidatus Cloacimonadota bacterium]